MKETKLVKDYASVKKSWLGKAIPKCGARKVQYSGQVL